VILRAFPEVLARVPYAHLVIAGDGEYESSVERLTQDAALREHVTRFPWLDQHELVRLLSISDVFLYPSIPHEGWTEQFGYSMAEASLMELPVISTRTGSIGEVVRDGETGVLVAPDDAQQLRDAMIRLALDEKARRKLGEAGREYIREQYEHECVARRYATFFRLIRP
jgi:glycosyltransferase involved in cell wall biosynthesis